MQSREKLNVILPILLFVKREEREHRSHIAELLTWELDVGGHYQ